MIKIFGIGHMGIRLADNLKALSVSERLGGAIGKSPHRIQFIGVDTENTNLGYSGVDVGFYIGEEKNKNDQGTFNSMRERTQSILSHIVKGGYFVLIFVDIESQIDCAAALAIAELAQARQIVTVSLVCMSDEGLNTKALPQFKRFRAVSDVLLSEHLDPSSAAVNSYDLIECAHAILRALYLPNQQLVGCDFQDVRTVFATMPTERVVSQFSSNLSFMRLPSNLDILTTDRLQGLTTPLALQCPSRMLIYIQGGDALQMRHVRDIVMTIRTQSPVECFIKYCVEKTPGWPESKVTLSILSIRAT